ncbi:isochorismatase family protein [Zooshikella harenae]|uniref:Isochorismatase family protein n=1 Tax=Zooshikella harenae TaxID=2827238 RepID=A0ABS5Z6I9_9GAMM|nr:isochorismatase family protein [Zooshikella harenae]MBU2709615.1 isochorismatase family protein [Zooshikella harenae]
MSQTIYNEVMDASQAWIEAFNKGNIEQCINTYTETATMRVNPVGEFNNKAKIAEFWQTFSLKHPAELTYRNIQLRILSPTHVILSADWQMNIASGFITKELWVKDHSGKWLLAEDDFSVLAQHDAIPTNHSSRTALLIIDMQQDYFPNGKMPLSDIEVAAENTRTLLTHFRSAQQPIIHVQHIFKHMDAPFFQPNSEGKEIHPSLAPQSNEIVITKHKANSTLATTLEQYLIEKGISQLIIVGAMAHMCIDAITRSLSDKGYQCTIINDACAAPSLDLKQTKINAEDNKALIMYALQFAYGDVYTTTEWLAQHQR